MLQIRELIVFMYLLGSVGYFAYMVFQKKILYNTSQVVMGVGLILHTTLLLYRSVTSSVFPVNNLYEILSVIAWSIATIFFVVQRKYHLRALGVCAAPLCAFIMIGSCSMPKTLLNNSELVRSVWLGMHVFSTFLGYAAFALAFGSGILYIIQENAIKKKKRGFFFNRLPSLQLLDNTGYTCVGTGFVLLTIGLITGAFYANFIWGYFWSWDPKEIWSAVVWFFYAVLLHGRLIIGWRGRRSAFMTIIGFGVLLFSFLGVNFLLKGHHGPFIST